MRNLMPIGRFSQICRMSIPTLRFYDESGLLRPEAVDRETGYRYYSMAQAITADRIRTLRFLEMPLAEIRTILEGDRETEIRILEGHRVRLTEQADRQRRGLALLELLMRMRKEPGMEYEIHLHEAEPQLAASIRGRALWGDLGAFIPNAIREVAETVAAQGGPFAGAPYVIYHSADSTEADLDMEIGMPVSRPIQPTGRVVAATIEGGLVASVLHCGPYEEVGGAYRALGEWVQEHSHEMAGPPREVYLSDPQTVADPADLRTEIVWPLR